MGDERDRKPKKLRPLRRKRSKTRKCQKQVLQAGKLIAGGKGGKKSPPF